MTLQPWRTLSSRIVVDDKWMRLRADACESEGVRIDPYYVIETADMVCAVVVTRDDQLVLVRQYRHAWGGVTLELPAGRSDAGEDPLAACRRELREETGYAGGEARLLRTWSMNPVRYANRLHAVLVEGAEFAGGAMDDPAERIETVLWPKQRAAELLAHPDFVTSSQAGVLALALPVLST